MLTLEKQQPRIVVKHLSKFLDFLKVYHISPSFSTTRKIENRIFNSIRTYPKITRGSYTIPRFASADQKRKTIRYCVDHDEEHDVITVDFETLEEYKHDSRR